MSIPKIGHVEQTILDIMAQFPDIHVLNIMVQFKDLYTITSQDFKKDLFERGMEILEKHKFIKRIPSNPETFTLTAKGKEYINR
ncbi:hypothetical protein [Candidatus Hodarchaeum mangrovi]